MKNTKLNIQTTLGAYLYNPDSKMLAIWQQIRLDFDYKTIAVSAFGCGFVEKVC